SEGQPLSGSDEQLRSWLGKFDEFMRRSGYSLVGSAIQGAIDARGPSAIHPVEVSAGHCYVVAALGQAGRDLNLFLIDPLGGSAGQDIGPSEHAAVAFCPALSTRFLARLALASGEMARYLLVVYRGRQSVSLSQFFSDAGVSSASMNPDIQKRLELSERQLTAAGLSRRGNPLEITLAEREEKQLKLAIKAGQCYAFVALGGAGAARVSAQIVDDAGRVVASSQDPHGPDAVVRYCAEDDRPYRLDVRMASGRGSIFVVAYAGQMQKGFVAREEATGREGSSMFADTVGEGGGIDQEFRVRDVDMQVRGYQQLQPAQRGELKAHEVVEFALQLGGEQCYAFLAIGDAG
ncbi:MAG: hypothetical protein N2578_10310, partial [Bdellovibrionaceae bacterium]|nr:hypothetical protein [Pseudobdellovibrionaceae bacterium]